MAAASAFCVAALSASVRAAAPNDAFDQAIGLGSIAAWSSVVDTAAATAQVGEPSHPGFFSDHGSLWWTWIAPDRDGEMEFITQGGMSMHLYQGDRMDELTRIDANSAMPTNRRPIVAGQAYRLMVGGKSASTHARFVFHPRPPNDDLAAAAGIGNTYPQSITIRNDAATREPGEPAHWTSTEGGSLWWAWTAPADGIMRMDFPESPFFSWVIAAYRGNEVSALTRLGRAFSQDTNFAEFRVSAGEIIYLALANSGPANRASTTFRIDMRELPNNDDPENAYDLGTTDTASFIGDTTAATPDPQSGSSTPAVWWRWSPPVNGRVAIRFAHAGSFGSLSLLRLADDGTRQVVAANYHPLNVYCRADETYLIRYQNTNKTPVAIELALQPAPPNDDLADALPLPLSPTPFDISHAGSEPGESLNQSIWWHYTPPADGVLISRGSLFSGNGSPADLTPIVTESYSPDRHPVSANQTYFFANHHISNGSMPLIGTLDPRFIPLTSGNGAFAAAAPLGASTHGHVLGNMADAITEPNEPDPTGDSLWWQWTAPFNGVLAIDLKCCSSIYIDDKIRLYAGSSLANLTPVAQPSGWSVYIPIRAFTVTSGTTYHLRINRLSPLFDFEYHAFQLPYANDHFATPTDLGHTTFHQETVFFSGATKQTGEPTHDPASSPATASRWWSWTAPADMTVDISGPVAAVYLGDSFLNLQPVGSDYPFSTGKIHRFPALAGQTYRIALVGRYEQPVFRLSARPSPDGDRFADPENLGNAGQAVLTTDLIDHTHEPGELPSIFQFGMSHWWQWTAPRDGTVSLNGGFTYGTWSFVLGSDLATATYPGDTDIPVTAGQVLRIRQRGTDETTRSRNLDFRPYEPNDNFANGTNLGSVETTTVTLDAYHATAEPGESSLPGASSQTRSLWWRWTAPGDGILALTPAAGFAFDSFAGIAVFEGDSLDALTRLRDTSVRPRHFCVLAGHSYLIRFASVSQMRFSFDLALLPGVSNDHWVRAIDLGNAAQASGTGTLVNTTPESFSPDASRAGTAWWKWTAPADGTGFIHVSPSRHVQVFTDPASGVPLGIESMNFNLASPGYVFPVSGGQTFWISIGMSSPSTSAPVNLLVNHLPHPANTMPDQAASLALDAPAAGSFFGMSTADAVDPTLWWQWTAPASGPYQLDADSGTLRVFAETSPGEWTLVAESSSGTLIWGPVAGVNQRIAVVGTRGDWSDVSLSLTAAARVTHDAFADAIVLSGNAVQARYHNIDATAEPGEPEHGGTPAERSVWYAWTAPEAIEMIVRLASQQSRFAIYSGDTLESITPLAAGTSEARLHVEPGVTYRIAVDGVTPEAFVLSVRPYLVPPNDLLATRIILPVGSPIFSGDLADATAQPGEPAGVTASLWWQWRPATSPSYQQFRVEGPEGDDVTLWLHNTGYSPTHSQFFNSAQRLAPGSIVTFQANVWSYFHLRATSDPPPAGQVTFRLVPVTTTPPAAPVVRPVNDDFGNAIHLGDAPVVRSSAIPFAGITNEAGEPLLSWTYRALWWSWTAPATGQYQLRRTTPATAALRVHIGDALAALAAVPLNTGGDILHAEAGVTYRFQALTNQWDPRFNTSTVRDNTTIGFEILPVPAAATNDDFAAAINLGSALNQSTPSNNLGATAEPGEPDHAGTPANRSVWFRWTAPESGGFQVDVFGATMRCAVYTGNDPANLTEVASGVEPLNFSAVAGTPFRIALDSDRAEIFSIRIRSITLPPVPGPLLNDHFASAVPLAGGPHVVSASLRGSTVEFGEPLTSSARLYSVWWAWTATESGPVTLSAPTVVLAAYSGSSFADLQPVVTPASEIRFFATAGVTYWIAASQSSDARDFILTIDPTIAAPPHDRFADALELGGSPASGQFATAGASQEPGQPTPGVSTTARTVWAKWTAPASDIFDITLSSTTTANHTLEVFTGDAIGALRSLGTATSRFRLNATAGTDYSIALFSSTPGTVLDLDIQLSARPPNDDFASRIHLGQALDEIFHGITFNATVEAGEILVTSDRTATVWWSWTAPSTGSYALEIEAGSPSVGIYTGNALGGLTTLIASNYFTLIPFNAQAGVTYLFSTSNRPDVAEPFAFTIRGTPPPNDSFANRILLDSQLPLTFVGRTSLATVEVGEPLFAGSGTGRTIWWEWTSPVDGAVDLIGPTGTASTVRLFTGDMLSLLRAVPVTAPAGGVQRFSATAGTRYIIGFSATTYTLQSNQAEFALRPARPQPANDRFADAIALSGESTISTSHNWGAGVENGEPSDLTRSLWWTWAAPRNGSIRVTTTHGVLHLYRGDSPEALVPAAYPGSVVSLSPVFAGETFRIAVSTTADPVDVALSVEMSPPGDDFHAPITLPSIDPVPILLDLSLMGWEPLEPPHNGKPAEHSAWFRWTAPDRMPVTLSPAPSSGIRIAVYTGEELTALTPVAEGTGEITFLPQRGETYHIAIDSNPGTAPGTVTLSLAQQLTGYAAWRVARFPDPNSPSADPYADPDGDGRVNLLEMALGTHPLVPDAAPDAVRIRDAFGYVTVSVVRPAGMSGLGYVIEVSAGLDQPWQDARDMQHLTWSELLGGGREEFHVLLIPVKSADHPRYFARLRVVIE